VASRLPRESNVEVATGRDIATSAAAVSPRRPSALPKIASVPVSTSETCITHSRTETRTRLNCFDFALLHSKPNQRPSKPIRAHQRPSEAIGGQSEAIRGQSEASRGQSERASSGQSEASSGQSEDSRGEPNSVRSLGANQRPSGLSLCATDLDFAARLRRAQGPKREFGRNGRDI